MRWREVGVVFEKAGVNALPIVSLISLLMGLVIAFEAAQPLEMFGAQIFIADMIGLVMVREFSPIFTAIILAGRSGAAFAAEIGTMKVNEELDALETMGLDPVRFLVIQRIFAATLLMPVLTAYSMLVGVFGGVLVMLTMGFPLTQIWAQLHGALGVHDVLVGAGKSLVFGAIVAGLGCLRGHADEGRPQRRRRFDDPGRRRRDSHDHRRRRRLRRRDVRAERMSETSGVSSAPAVIAVENFTIAYGEQRHPEGRLVRGPPGRGLRHPRRLGLREELAAEAHDRPLSPGHGAHPLRGRATSRPPRGRTVSGSCASSA